MSPDRNDGEGDAGDDRVLLADARERLRRLGDVASRYEADLAARKDAAMIDGAAAYRQVAEAVRRLAEDVEEAERGAGGAMHFTPMDRE